MPDQPDQPPNAPRDPEEAILTRDLQLANEGYELVARFFEAKGGHPYLMLFLASAIAEVEATLNDRSLDDVMDVIRGGAHIYRAARIHAKKKAGTC